MKHKHITRAFEIKAVGDDGMIEGYGSVFGNVDSYRDVVMPGAFNDSLVEHGAKGTMPAMLWQHRSDMPCGVWTSMKEDDHGLHVVGQLCLDSPRGREVRALAKMKAVRGLSIGFSVPEGGEEYDEQAKVSRLKKIKLWEVSMVTFPANEAANISEVRSQWLADRQMPAGMLEEILSSRKRLEGFLRDVGLPKVTAKQLAGRYIPDRSEADKGSECDVEMIDLAKRVAQSLRNA